MSAARSTWREIAPPRPFTAGIALLATLTLAGCATTYSLFPDQRTPAAQAIVKVSIDRNGNTLLRLTAEHLAPPPNLGPDLTTYVLWVRPLAGQAFTNAGQLTLDANRAGKLNTTVPWPSVELMLTAEPSGTPDQPSQHVVLRGPVTRR